jgi:hypothetical protein
MYSHTVLPNTSVSLYCCYNENNCHLFRQTGQYIYSMNSWFVHVVCVCVCWGGFILIFYFLSSDFILTKPVYH